MSVKSPPDDKTIFIPKEHLLGDRYLIVKLLGDGASGRVYLVKDTTQDGANSLRAIKQLSPRTNDLKAYKILCERFEHEKKYLRLLRGFNGQIPILYGEFSEKQENGRETRYIVQEFIEGKTLKERLAAEISLNEAKVKEILVRLLPVIAHIHANGWIHRDIDPSNIILRKENDLPVLIDFGAVKDADATLVRGYQTIIIGKDGYMAPEHDAGNPVLASDLYSIGMTAIALLSGLKPAEIERDPSTRKRLWRKYVSDLSGDFVAVIDKAIEESVERRYETAQAMLRALESVATPDRDDKNRRQSGASLSAVLERPPKPLAKRYINCLEKPCDFFLTLQDNHCLNCGAYNMYRLSDDDIHLIRNSVEEHLARIYPDDSQSSVIGLAEGIEDVIENSEEAKIWIGCGGVFIGAIVGWTLGEGFVDTFRSCIQGAVIGLLGAFVLFVSTWLLAKAFLVNHKRRLRDLHEKKKRLQNQLYESTNRYRESSLFYLNRTEKEINEQIGYISNQERGIKDRLLSTQSAVKGNVYDLKKDEETLQHDLIKLNQKRNNYGIKLLEIKLLRLYNKLQAETYRKLMSNETRATVEKDLEKLYELVELMSNSFESNMMSTGDVDGWGKDWVARIVRAKDILPRLRSPLTRHINYLFRTNRKDEIIAPPEEFVRNLNLLNAYVTAGDFYTEYQELQSA